MDLLEENDIFVINIPANGTDRLQPMDVNINKSVKDFMRGKFTDGYSEQVHHQLNNEEYRLHQWISGCPQWNPLDPELVGLSAFMNTYM